MQKKVMILSEFDPKPESIYQKKKKHYWIVVLLITTRFFFLQKKNIPSDHYNMKSIYNRTTRIMVKTFTTSHCIITLQVPLVFGMCSRRIWRSSCCRYRWRIIICIYMIVYCIQYNIGVIFKWIQLARHLEVIQRFDHFNYGYFSTSTTTCGCPSCFI